MALVLYYKLIMYAMCMQCGRGVERFCSFWTVDWVWSGNLLLELVELIHNKISYIPPLGQQAATWKENLFQ